MWQSFIFFYSDSLYKTPFIGKEQVIFFHLRVGWSGRVQAMWLCWEWGMALQERETYLETSRYWGCLRIVLGCISWGMWGWWGSRGRSAGMQRVQAERLPVAKTASYMWYFLLCSCWSQESWSLWNRGSEVTFCIQNICAGESMHIRKRGIQRRLEGK